MSRVLLVASDPNELKGLDGDWNRCVCGVGPLLSAANTVKYALETKACVVVSVGSAGSLGRLERGEVISFGEVVTPDQDLSAMHIALGSTIGENRATFRELRTLDSSSPYILYTSGKFNTSVIDSHRLLKADAADMEAYGVGIAARVLGIGFYAVKLITDTVGVKATVGDISFSYREGRARLSSFLSSMLG